MDDSAPVHQSRLSSTYKINNDIPTLEWPAQFSDLNSINNVLLVIKKNFSHFHIIKSVDELYEKILDIWASFTVDYVKRKTCMHQFRQACAEFNRPLSTSQNTKVTHCFLHSINLRYFFLQFYAHINLFVQFK